MDLTRKRLGIFILAVAIVSVGLQVGAFVIAVPVIVNTETQDLEAGGIEGTGSSSFDGELLDGTQYITSWMANGDSEKLVAQGAYAPRLFQAAFIRGCRYFWSLNTGLGWNAMAEPIQEVVCPTSAGATLVIVPVAQRVLHSPLVGGVRVELQLSLSFDPTGIISPFTWQTVARDEAHLRPGVGDIGFSSPLYAIGETAVIRYDVGYASSVRDGGTWSIQLFEPRDRGGAVVRTWVANDNTRGQVEYTFVVTDFVAGESNVFAVKLLNTITGVKDDDAAVVDDIDLAPQISSVTVTPVGTRSVGDQMTVTIHASANERTGLAIKEYYFHVRSGPSTVVVDGWQASNVFVFSIQNDGDIQVNGCVRDAERSNCFRRINVQVEEPDGPFGKDNVDPFMAPWWLFILVGVFLGGAAGVQFLPQIPPGGRNILSLFFIAGTAVLLLNFLVIPALEAWFRDIIPGVG